MWGEKRGGGSEVFGRIRVRKDKKIRAKGLLDIMYMMSDVFVILISFASLRLSLNPSG